MSLVEPMRSNARHGMRFSVDCLTVDTRRLLLDAIGRETIIAGAYSDAQSICPALAVHRREALSRRKGGVDSLVGFARAWDAFTQARPGHPRLATGHELTVLREMLEASLAGEAVRRERLRRVLNAMAAPRRSAAVAAPGEEGIERPPASSTNGDDGLTRRRFARERDRVPAG